MIRNDVLIKGKWNGNKYLVLDKIGQGGIGYIYKVRDTKGDIKALKISSDMNSITREFNMMKEMMGLRGIPQVYELDDFVYKNILYYYFTMEYISGQNLKELVKDRSINVKEALGIAFVILNELEKIYNKGYIYHDIKLENIILDRKRKRILLLDFGGVTHKDQGIKEYTPTYTVTSWRSAERSSREENIIFGVTMIIISVIFKIEFNPLLYTINDIEARIKKMKSHKQVKNILLNGINLGYKDIKAYKNELKNAILSKNSYSIVHKTEIDKVNLIFFSSICFFLIVFILGIKSF